MKNTLVILLVISVFTPFFAQNAGKLDSLLLHYESAEGILEKKKYCNIIILHYAKKKDEKAFEYGELALSLKSSKIDSIDVETYIQIARAFQYIHEFDTSIVLLRRGLKLAEDLNNTALKGKIMDQIGYLYYRGGKMDSAIIYNKNAEKILRNTKETNLKANNQYRRGVFNRNIGKNQSAITAYLNAIQLYKEMGNEKYICWIYTNIGNLFNSIEESQKAISYYQEALNLAIERKDSSIIAANYNNIGLVHKSCRNDSLAMLFFVKARDLNEKMNNELWYAYNLNNIGIISLNLGNYNDAIQDIEQSIQIKKRLNDHKQIASSYAILGGVYAKLNLGVKSIKQYEKAIEYLESSGSAINRKDIYLAASKVNLKFGSLKSAYEYLQNAYTIMDSTLTKEKIVAIHDIETKYQTTKKEQKIKDLEYNEKLQESKTKLYIGGLISAGIIILLILFFFYLKRKKDLALVAQKELTHKKEKELAKIELEKIQLKEKELQKEIIFKSKQLTTHALHMMQKNQLLQELKTDLKGIVKTSSPESKQSLKMLTKNIERGLRSDNDWDVFRKYFEEVNQDFFAKLTEINPEITGTDFKIAALVKLNLNIKESASILSIEPNSIKSARYRLRKKLNLKVEDSLGEYIRGL